MVNGKLERREEAIDLALGYRLNCVKARKRQPWTPKRIDLAFGVPAGCRRKHGKRQAWTPMTGCKGFKPFEGF